MKESPKLEEMNFRKTPEVKDSFSRDNRIISMSFDNTPFDVVMGTISAETGAAIVWGKDCDETNISGVYQNSHVWDILLAIAKRNGMQLSEQGGVYFIGMGSKNDAVSTVIRAPSSDCEKLQEALQCCLSDYGSICIVGSSLVVNDYLYNVKKVVDMSSKLLSNGLRGYVAELYFIRMKDSDLLDIEAKLSAENVDLFSCSWNLDELFKAVLDISGESTRMKVENRPIMYLSEGRKAVLEVGNELVKSQNAVSSEGYSTVTGYKSFNDGVKIELTPHRLTTDIISLDVVMNVSDFSEKETKYSDIPSSSKSSIESPGVLLVDGSIGFLGSLRQSKTEQVGSLFGFINGKSDEIITVWVKIREISLNRY